MPPPDRSPTGPSEARAWLSELSKRLHWPWIIGIAVVFALGWAAWTIAGR
jgi:hypothetical protein